LGSETNFHSFIKYTPAITYTAKADEIRSILYISPQVEKLLGFSGQEFITKPDTWYRLIHPGDRGRVMDAVSDLRAGIEKVVTEYRIFTRDGKLLHFHDQAVAIPGDRENPPCLQGIMLDITGFVNILNDITDRRQMEKELLIYHNHLDKRVNELTAELVKANKNLQREIDRHGVTESLLQAERDKLKSILDAMDDGVCMVSSNYDVEYANPVIEREFGPVKGRKCYEYFHGVGEICLECNSRDVFAGKSVRWEYHSSSGKTFDLYDAPIRNSDGSISKLEFFHDVTDRKKDEVMLLDYQKKLRSMAAELSMVEERERRHIAMDIHDYISQSLAAVKIKLETIKHSPLSPDTLEGFNRIGGFIDEAIGYTQSLITDLSISTLQGIDFSEALEWLCNQFQERHGIRISFEKSGEINLIGEETRVILIKSVRELLNNAVKHSKAKNVKISYQSRNSKIHVTVEDDGIGFKVDHKKLRLGKNGGFGLFSIRESLNHLGGNMTVRSGSSKGTVITLKAPLKILRRGRKN